MEPIHIIMLIMIGLAWIGYVACLAGYYWITLALTAIGVGYFVTKFPITDQTMPEWSVTAVAVVVAAILAARRRSRQRRHMPMRADRSARRVVIDGTNVMYWNGEVAKLETLRVVVDELVQNGYVPVVFLDASSRHHLKDKSLTEKRFAKALDLPQKQVMVCPAGTEADVFILKFANQEALPIISNDRFADRSDLTKGITIVKGVVSAGRPILDGLEH